MLFRSGIDLDPWKKDPGPDAVGNQEEGGGWRGSFADKVPVGVDKRGDSDENNG